MGRLIKRIQFVVGVALCLFCLDSTCQIDKESFEAFKAIIPQENIVLQANTNTILAGETLFYKLYCLSSTGKLSLASKIGYVELIGANKKNLFKHKLQLNKGLANGDFFIPPNIETGHYKLVAYTKWMNNNSANPFFQSDVYIINPFIPNDDSFENKELYADNLKEIKKTIPTVLQKNTDIKLETNKKVYKFRENVEITMSSLLGESNYGNYSVSVRKLDLIGVTDHNSNNKVDNYDEIKYLPEIRGEVISGQVLSKSNNKIVADMIVALSIPGSHYIYKNVKTDQRGKFYFNIHENYNDSEVIIQVLDKNKGDYNILLDDSSFKYADQLKYAKIKVNENTKDWLLKQSIHNQIESAYHNAKRDSIVFRSPNTMFYGNPTVKYFLDDYTRFPSVKETFVEIIAEAAVRKSGDNFSFKVYNYEELRNNVFKEYNPLVLFDGILIQNNLDVLDYDSNKIESVSVVRGIYFNGPSIFNGIIDIKTKKSDFKLPKNREAFGFLNLDAIKENKIYYNPIYTSEVSKLNRIPDYRSQLLWEPNLFFNSNSSTINFYTSDVKGVFEITLEGYSNAGKYIISKMYFEVGN
ncbi:hypothetical protein FPF71_08780 [Algibacter amylolyticus]|uniref:Carboxypeptidase regulatory-like domain-containing protein n=1 Tax=Algibacter amylolyticus TaxID=1608400 RepID=A0A5M7B961_9FLAO|nr:hypothetical protein [Algibacter amylolyticus]KAA5824767.1 hypothetical protein F2B50_08780 [Algibacter amylolyticus]MBB5268881.1 hypothetical protein [Algibacter amylolyticus]TSJ75932.1 hypothetical protein FPF71_08780 [Algibacter amylolyticus]